MMPPRMQRGMVTRAQMTEITMMVPKGSACVDYIKTRKAPQMFQGEKMAWHEPALYSAAHHMMQQVK